MPAKPGFMERLITMTVRALSTSRIGMPYMGLDLSVRAAGLVTSFAPMTSATSHCPNSPLMSSIANRPSCSLGGSERHGGAVAEAMPALRREPAAEGRPGAYGRVPAAEVNARDGRLPKKSRRCAGNLPQKPGPAPTAGEPRRHPVTEVPPVKAHLTEYQFPNVVCGQIGRGSCREK